MMRRASNNARCSRRAKTLLRKIRGVTFDEERQLQRAVSGYIQFYHERRLHSSIGYVAHRLA